MKPPYPHFSTYSESHLPGGAGGTGVMTSRRDGQVNSWRLREHQPGEVQADFLEEGAEARGGVAAAAGFQHLQSLVLLPGVLGSLSCWAALKQEPPWPGGPGFFPATY